MRTALEGLVEALEKAPETPARAINALPEAERRQVAEEWNATEADYPKEKLIHELFEEQAEKSPHAVALVYEKQSLTYGELKARANRLAHHLRGLGVGPESRVAICLERSLEMVVAMLATLKAGGAYVPLDPDYPSERLAYMLEDSEPVVLLTQGAARGKLAAQTPGVCVVNLYPDAPQWAGQSNADPECAELNARRLAYILYTSGSTGLPKGVAIENRSVVNFICWAKSAFNADTLERTLFSTSINFDLAVYELFVPLAVGATTTIVGNALDLAQSPVEVTLINTVPSAMKSLVDTKGVPKSIRAVNLAGEPLKRELVESIFAATEAETVCNLYGPSETTTYSTWVAMGRGKGFEPHIGQPIANTQIYILDEWLKPTPVGVSGEIHIGGNGEARGYLNRPEMTAERFLPDPFSREAGKRVYKTGDLGRWAPAGNIEFLGRNDYQVKVRGYRIELGEIETRLMSHPEVREAIVVAREEGEGGKRLVAYYTGKNVGAEALLERILSELPVYMAPAAFVHLERLPLTQNGKLDRRRLPAPEGGAYLTRGYDAPMGEIEIRIARIWAEILKVERVGRHDNFFELGGHSLLALTVIERMRCEGMKSDVPTLFTAPTLRALAETVRDGECDVEAPPNLIPAGCQRITPEMLSLVELTQPEINSIVEGVAGGALNVQDIYPLAPLQEGLLFHHLLETEGDVYLNPALYAFDARERLERFVGALQAVIDRHDILRTAVQWEGLSEPVQVVWRRAPLDIEEVSLDPMAGDAAEKLYTMFDPRRYRIDVRRAPLMRIYIAHDARKDRWLMLCLFHHLLVDHTTLEVLEQEVQAHLLGREGQLPAPLPFRNFVAQARLGVSREEHERFFREMLWDVDEPTAPYGLIDVQGDGSDIREARREVDPVLAGRLRQISRALGVSAASLYHLAWAMALGRVSGRNDVVFGTVLFGRLQGVEGADRALGLFNNTLPIRIRGGAKSVEESVRQTHQSLTKLMRHEHASLALAQRLSGVEAPTPLFTALLNYRYSVAAEAAVGADEDALPAWEGSEFLRGHERSNYPFSVSVDDMGEEFVLNAQAQSPADPDRICAYLHTALEQLVEALDHAPATSISNLDVLPASERRQLLVEWNETGKSYSPDFRVSELFEEQAERNLERIALIGERQVMSYGELNRRGNQLGNYLRGLGVGLEAVVGLCLGRSVEVVVGLLGAVKAGAAYLPLDPEHPWERLSFMLEDAGVGVVLTERKLEDRLSAFRGQTVCLDVEWERIGQESDSHLISEVDAENLAYVIYTSGSTGKPKGVAVRHAGLVNLAEWHKELYEVRAADRASQLAALSFDASVWEIWPYLISGASLHIADEETRRDAERLWKWIRSEEITKSFVPTPLAEVVLQSGWEKPELLELMLTGGDRLRSRPRRGQGLKVFNNYGPTEATVVATSGEVTEEGQGVPSIGRPIRKTRLYILDGRMNPAPVGAKGELYIAGVGLARGYRGRPDLTAERFIPDLFNAEGGGRLYRTGDVARYLVNGEVEFVGRADNQVNIRGYRIELEEIGAVLNESPSVKQSVVVAREDKRGEKRLVGYIVGEEGASSAELKSHLRERLPEHMIPEEIVVLKEMPLTASGKIDRKRLPPAPTLLKDAGRQMDQEYVAPRTQIEELTLGIFGEVLRLDRIGVRDNFFEIGGHSLLATQVISRVRNSFGVEIGVRSVFEHPTPEGLSRRIKEAMMAGEKVETPPLVRINPEGGRGRRAPLSFAQLRLWFVNQLNPDSAVYNIPGMVRLEGALNLDALERVINEIVRRHEVLRTRIEVEAGEPAQVINEWEPWKLEVLDLTRLSLEEREAEINRRERTESETGFDLGRGPLLRVKVLKLEEEEHVLLYTMHHIVSDGWSMEILYREVAALYQAYLAGDASPLPELPIQYADFAVWQREWLQGQALEREMQYWQEQLTGVEDLELPIDHPRPEVRSHRGRRLHFVVERELTRILRESSRRQGATLFMTLLGALNVVLSRYSGQDSVAIGTDIANRNRAEIEGLIGFFVNQLVLRVNLRAGERFNDFLKRVRDVCLKAYAYQDAPFEKLVERLRPERDLSRSPLFQVKLILENMPREEQHLGTLRMVSGNGDEIQAVSETQTARFDLLISIIDGESSLFGLVEYSLDLFESETVERLISHYANALGSIADSGEKPISELSLLSETERRQILVEWNASVAEYPRARRIHELFTEQAARTPDRTALVSEGHCVSYRALNQRANQLGNYLRKLGVGPEVVVGLCLDRSVEMVVAILGVFKSGGAYLPLDPDFPVERLALLLDDAGVGVALTQQSLGDRLRSFGRQTVLLDEEWEKIDRENNGEPESRAEAENLAYVIYTSGSTGRPKGVMVSHGSLVNYTHDICRRLRLEEIEEGARFATISTITADLGNTCIYPSLLSGGCLHVLSYEVATDRARYEEYLRSEPIDVLKIVPSHLNALLENRSVGVRMLPDRYLILGGEGLSYELVDRIRRRNEGCKVINHYGPTETTIGSLTARAPEMEGEMRRRSMAPIGRPIANTVSYILDRELNPAPVGVKGELYIGGEGVARGYLRRPDLTAERFIPNQFSSKWGKGERAYRTGDVVRYLSDGMIEFIGRADFQVKLRGYRIELGEIEEALKGYPGVSQAVVAAREDEPGQKRLVGYVASINEPLDEITPEALKKYLREKLPEYMTPARIVVMDELPLTPNGKVDRRALSAHDGSGSAARDYEAPVGRIETRLAALWADVLGLERVSRNDNFFTLGGHSLLAVILIERMRNEGLHTDVRAFFASPTMAALAATVNRESDAVEVPPNLIPPGCQTITPEMLPLAQLSAAEIARIVGKVPGGAANVQDIYPLAPLQEGILFHYLLETEGDPYLGRSLYLFDTRRRMDDFLQALQAVINRHDILRTSVHWEGLSEPMQVVCRRAPLIIEEVDCDPAGDVVEQLRARFDPRHYRLDISQAPMMRACVAPVWHNKDTAEPQWVMLLLFQHLSLDHVTTSILSEEIQTHLLRRAEQLPAPLPFRNFVAQARLGMSREAHESFFREMLGDVDEPTTPYDLIDAQNDGSEIRASWLEIDQALSARLRQTSRALELSAASLCHLACALVLGRVSGRDDVVFGTVLFGRMQSGEGSDRAPGMFINTLPVRIRAGGESVLESVRRTHSLLTELLKHEHAPLALAQRCSAVAAPAPLFSAYFNYRHNPTTEIPAGENEENHQAWEGIEALSTEQSTSYPFSLTVDDWGRSFTLGARVQSPIDPGRVCAYMRVALEQLVEALESAPATPLRDLDVLPASERRQLLMDWNDAKAEYPRDRCVHELFTERAERVPERIALVCEGHWLSYGELNRRANQLGNYLQRLGVGPEVVVGVCLERSVEMGPALLGALKAGGAYLPLDPESPVERLSYVLEDAGVRVTLTQRVLKERLQVFNGLTVCMDEGWERINQESERDPESGEEAENLAYVIYTSGSTGRPKGVMVRHRSLVNYSHDICQRLGLEEGEAGRGLRFATVSTIAADLGNTCIYPSLLGGGCLHILSYEVATDGARYEEYLKREPINVLKIVPSHLNALLGTQRNGIRMLPYRFLILGGEALSRELVERIIERGEGCKVINHYGPTETTIGSLTAKAPEMEEAWRCATAPIGRPIANTAIYILDSELNPAPVEVRGELHISGEGVARGYLKRPDLTAERFTPNPFGREGGERVYRTGDVCRYLPDGKVQFLGRADDQVKIRGYRVELGEIQAVLNERRSVRQSVVVAREDDRGNKRLIAYVVGERGVTRAELKLHLRERLPAYMAPEDILLLEEMPVTANGKIDRKRLPAVENAGRQLKREYVGPRTPVEEILVEIFEEVLNLDRVGIHDDFFEIGGHSLLATRVISRVRSAFDLEIGVRNIFDETTVAKLAAILIAHEPKPGQTEKIAMIHKRLDGMTDEEMIAELSATESGQPQGGELTEAIQ